MTILRPISGDEFKLAETLASCLTLDYPHYEVIFCVSRESDPAAAVAATQIGRFPHANARILFGADSISDNPKLNNFVKGWKAARHDIICMTDSNVLMPRDYLSRCLAAWDTRAGLVSSPPAGVEPLNLAAEIEAAFLNSYQARWQYAANAVGFAFAQGKTLMLRRSLVGDVRALASDLAEDAAATKLVRAAGLKVRLACGPFPQPLGLRTWDSVWNRQTRWAQLRRMSFPGYYALEIATGAVPATLVAICWAATANVSIAGAIAALWFVWFGSEMMLARIAGWPATFRSLGAIIIRDAVLPILWIAGWRRRGYVWQGHIVARAAK